MHILHYVGPYLKPLGGGEIFARGLTLQLQKYRVEQSVIVHRKESEPINKIPDRINDIKILPLRLKNKTGSYSVLENLPEILLDKKYDIIHIHGYGTYVGDMVCILKRLRRLRTPLILATNGMSGLKLARSAFNFSFPLNPLERMIRLSHILYDTTLGLLEISSFDKIIILSNLEKKFLPRLVVNRKKIVNIPIAIDKIFTVSSVPSDRTYLLYAGRIDRFKGIDILMQAIRELKDSNIKIHCLVIGKDVGYKSNLENIINELNLNDIIEIRDQVTQEELSIIYSSALVTILPSLTEGFPLTLVESMASGTPFIATPVGAVPELVEMTGAGLLVPFGDAGSLATTIRKLLHDSALWHQLSNNGVRWAKNFTWEKIAEKYYELYRSLIN